MTEEDKLNIPLSDDYLLKIWSAFVTAGSFDEPLDDALRGLTAGEWAFAMSERWAKAARVEDLVQACVAACIEDSGLRCVPQLREIVFVVTGKTPEEIYGIE